MRISLPMTLSPLDQPVASTTHLTQKSDLTTSPSAVSGSTKSSVLLRRLLGWLKPHRGLFFASLLCMVIFGSSDGAIPFLVKYILDGVFAEQNESLLYLLPILMVSFAVLRAFVDFGQQFLISKVGHLIVRDIRNAVDRQLLQLPPAYFVRASAANIISRVTNDVMLVRTLLTDTLAAVIRDSIRIVALIATALYLDPVLALIAVVVFPIGVYPVIRFGKRMRRLSRQGQEGIGALSSMLNEQMLGNRVVRIFGQEKNELARFEEENQKLTRVFIKSERVRAITGPINEVLASLAISGVLIYGGLSVISGVRTQGDFIAFLLSIFLLYDPFKKLSRINNNVQQGLAGAERIFEILDYASEIAEPANPVALPHSNSIEFINVSYNYPGTTTAAVHGINLKIGQGQRVALVGLSGSGKSTLIDLVPRFIDPTAGVVKVGGVDVSQTRLQELRSKISMVGQHTFLFNDTVAKNIAYSRADATIQEIEAAARAASAYEFIKNLPNGFETMVGEAGYALSGGERQRIAIARAILKDSPILILDEATAALDNHSEREVQRALEKLEQNRTSLVIAHRLSTVRDADLIVVMRAGEIVERGTHAELLARGGEFKRLYELQFAAQENREDQAEQIDALRA